MKLTNKARNELERVLRHLERAERYIMQDEIVVCRKRDRATTTQDYKRGDGQVIMPLTKDIGSDFAGLEMGITRLKDFIGTH